MTLEVVTTLTLRCDGLVASACNVTHPDRPHTCPAALPLTGDWTPDTIRAARWTIVEGDLLWMSDARHYCPAHAHQAPERTTDQ